MKQDEIIQIGELTPEEQNALFAHQQRQNKILALVLFGLVVFFFFTAYFVVTQMGIVPMEDQDIFRST